MNGILYDVTAHIQFLNAGGQARFDAALATAIGGYPIGVVLQSDDGQSAYVNVLAGNTDNFNTTPASIGVSWLPYAGIALKKGIIPGATFAELDAATADQGPAICTDMGGYLYKWVETAYFSGYRNVRIGELPDSFATINNAWWMAATGGVWNEADPKHRRLIAWFREQGQVVAAIDWAPRWGRIADLGGGDWKAADLQNVFKRYAGTDADTANAVGVGVYKGDTIRQHWHQIQYNNSPLSGTTSITSGTSGSVPTATSTGSTGTAETAPVHIRVSLAILI